jgi:hypothetical protein
MVDGKIARVITERSDIDLLAGTSEFDRLDKTSPVKSEVQVFPKAPLLQASVPVFGGAD